MFYILDPSNEEDFTYLAQMHHLRYNIFHKNLKWQNGLQLHSQMEFDQYDHQDAKYVVRINEQNRVDACARLTPTNQPYLLGHSYGHYIHDIEIPSSPNVVEISRLCADPKTAPRNITGQLMAVFLEYALHQGIIQFVSLSDIKIIPLVKRYGWQANKLGPCQDTGTDISVALSYDVTKQFHDNVKRVVGALQDPVLAGHFYERHNTCRVLTITR